jgi:hypothetical protein
MNRRWTHGAAAIALGALLALGLATPASAAPVGFAVDVVVHEEFGAASSEFEGNIPGCETGTVVTVPTATRFTRWGGVFVGVKEFMCDSGAGGFDVRLVARFGEAGSTGTWRIADAWGEFEGVRASGTLVGVPNENGIDDRYIGTAR